MLIFEAQNPQTVKDAYVTVQRFPQMDDCQDWEFVDSKTEDNFLIVQVRRKLNTGDTQDLAILNDGDYGVPSQRIIAAWGDDETFAFHGMKRARGTIRWFNFGEDEATVFQEAMHANAEGSFAVRREDYPIKPIETDYANFCITGDGLRAEGIALDDGVTIIGIDPVITSEYVHHCTYNLR
jgi:hypothetical protein